MGSGLRIDCRSNWALGVALFVSLLPIAGSAKAYDYTAHAEFIDTGTPKNGSVEMTGWHGVIVRIIIDQGLPITAVEFGPPFAGSLYGNMAQRWTDPAGQGHYTVTSPGPMTANNSVGSDFNFDSHFLGAPEMFTNIDVAEFSRSGFYPSRVPIPSDGFTGYGATSPQPDWDPFLYSVDSVLGGRLDFAPAFQQSSADVAYIVTDSVFAVHVSVYSGGTFAYGIGKEFPVPEPTSLGFFGVLLALTARRRPKHDEPRPDSSSLSLALNDSKRLPEE